VRPREIDQFFSLLAKRLSFPVTIVLTGGGAAILEGVSRATRDLDFQVNFLRASSAHQDAFIVAIGEVEHETGIAAQFDNAIESWSSISWPGPGPGLKSYRYKRFGSLDVRILDPLWWSIGKIARYLAYDVSDVIVVFKRMKVKPEQAARSWGKALGRSPLSNAQPIFRRQAIAFLKDHSAAVWGKKVNPAALEKIFLDAARRSRSV